MPSADLQPADPLAAFAARAWRVLTTFRRSVTETGWLVILLIASRPCSVSSHETAEAHRQAQRDRDVKLADRAEREAASAAKTAAAKEAA